MHWESSILILISFTLSEEGLAGFFVRNHEQIHDLENIVMIIAAVIVAPITEELIFRGVFLDHLNKEHSFMVANMIQALIFGILHFDIYLLVFFIGFGLILGIIKKYMNIYCCILIHALSNGWALCTIIFKIQLPDISLYYYLLIGIIFFFLTVSILFKLKDYQKYWS